MSARGELVDAIGQVRSGLALLHGVDLSKIPDDDLDTLVQLLELTGRFNERARRKALRALTDRARVRAHRASEEEPPWP